jgi:uncharacterized surface protein with fasciclin (FAS1) repeats
LQEATIVDFVVGNPDLTALTFSVVRAGLVDALNSDGSFTLFAPNDSAFAALPGDILDTLLTNDEFIPHLADLLLYHVWEAEVFSGHLFNFRVPTLNGETVLVSTPPIAVNGNKVISADNNVSNGVVHIIEGVLIPSWVSNSIAGRVVGDSDLSTLLALVVLAGLDGAVAAPGELTLVAPTNSAFAKLPAETVAFLTSDDGKETLTSILLYHVFPGIFVSSELSNGITVDTLQGGMVKVSIGSDGVFFNDARAVEVDILANNGVVHKIDTVLDPADGVDMGLPEGTIVDFVVGNPELTALTTAVVRAGLVDALNSDGPFTLFAPNNGAFGALPSAVLSTLLTNDEFIPHLVNLLLYHVVSGEVFAIDLSDDLTVTAANGEDLFVTLPPLAVNGMKVRSADNDVSNGVVHIIDGVLLPSWVSNSIAGRVVGASDLSTLLAVVVLAGLDGAVAAPGELTLVAPTNAAFAKLPAETVAFLTSDAGKETLSAILLYHVFPGIFVASELSDGLTVDTLQGGTVKVSVGSAGAFFNDAKAVQVDILANNGVVHKIDTVLDPADGGKTIVEFVVENDELTALTTAVVRAGLVDALNAPGPFTLFAPNNSAFGALPSAILNTLLTNDEFIPHLSDLLLYHVLVAEVFAISLSDDLTVTAANGEDLLITLPPIAVNGNKVVSADNDASNGVVHIIDGVLIPSWVSNSIASRVVGASDLSTLLALVVLAGLDGAVAAPGELTLVAPTNAAFAKLPAATVEFLVSDAGKETLTAILLYHVFPGIFVSSELSDGLTVSTAQGGTVKVSVGSTGVFFNDAQAVEVDILANNGVVHKIDSVLDPADGKTIVGFVVDNAELTSLTTAVVRAGLVNTLNSEGPFTLFAPNNGAFGALPSKILNTLLTNDEFIPHLVNLLAYHVLVGEFFAINLSDDLTVTAANGEDLLITLPPIAVNGNKVVSADNDVTNGVVHIIDGVLLPSWVSNSIAGRVVGASDLSTLLAVVVLAGLDGAVAAPGELTLVAPTNAAFAKLSAATVDFLVSDEGKETLTAILLYHVFPGIFVASELSDGLTVDTLQGGTVKVSVGSAGVFFNDAQAVAVDILANNGVVHKIDTVLDPADGVPEFPGTIVDFVVGNADLTSLTTAVVRAGLVNTLSSTGPFTLFAPNNSAFGALPSDILDTLLTNDEFIPHLVNLLAYHVLVGEAFSNDLSDDLTVTAANGENLLINLFPITVNGNKVVSADNDVTNGVVHIIDGVLLPSWVSNSIAGRVVGASDLSTLLSVVVLAGLDGAVAAPGELTLVAPTNAAFAKLPAATVEFLVSDAGKETLTAILLYHVFPGIFVSSELSDGLMIDSLQGGVVKVSVGSAGVFFNDAQAVEVDILANNGVVHKIDSVLDPADGVIQDIVSFVVGNPELTALTAAVVRAGLVGPLRTDGPFTLFAPNDSAFEALPSEILNTLLTNDEFIPHLADLLLYHVLDAKLKSSHIFNFKVSALNGEKLLLSTNPIAVNGNEVVSADNDVSNGVIHVIDGVLIPSWVSNSITGRVVGDSDLSTLLALVVLAGLDGALDGPGELTLVAPTNSAFAKLPADVVEFVTSADGKDTLVDILLYHVFPGIFVSSELSDGITVDTLQGGTVEIKTDPVKFNKARAVEVDILTNNGVVHKIDTVLDPADGVEKKGGKNGKNRN